MSKRCCTVQKKKRSRALILFLASTGARIGVVDDLKLKHIIEMLSGCKGVLFYEGTNEEYWGFLTPESSNALNEYLEERRKDGETIDQTSPLFRSDYRLGKLPAKPLSIYGAKGVIRRLVSNEVDRIKTGKRYDKQADHGFRKRFATIIKMDKKISWAVGEKLLGHKTYLDAEYFSPTKENLFAEFQKVIPDLTIDGSERDKVAIQDLQQQKSLLEAKTAEIPKMKKQIEHDHLVVQVLAKTMKEIGINFEYPDGTPYEIDENLKIPAEYLPEPVVYNETLVIDGKEIFLISKYYLVHD